MGKGNCGKHQKVQKERGKAIHITESYKEAENKEISQEQTRQLRLSEVSWTRTQVDKKTVQKLGITMTQRRRIRRPRTGIKEAPTTENTNPQRKNLNLDLRERQDLQNSRMEPESFRHKTRQAATDEVQPHEYRTKIPERSQEKTNSKQERKLDFRK